MRSTGNVDQKTAHWNSVTTPERVRERAHTKWLPDLDCWVSTYSVGSHGYAQVGWGERGKTTTVLAHRASWERVHGPMPAGKTLDHLCKNRRCVNPSHLRVLDNHENARRTAGRDWPLGQCVNGHDNSHLYTQPSGKRICRPCKAQTYARFKARHSTLLPRDNHTKLH